MIRDIQYLRALSVIAVIAYHINESILPGGYLGVDCFFIISGYIITLVAIRDRAKGEFSITRFYFKRFRRIVPALVLMAVFTTICSYVFFHNSLYRLTSETIPYALLQISNLKFLDGMSYFAPASNLNPLLHTWSLGVEEQFYLFFPFIFCLQGKMTRHRYTLFLAFIFLLSISLQMNLGNGHEFYNPVSRVWLFLLGGFVASFSTKLSGSSRARFVGYAGLIVGFYLFSNHIHASYSSMWIAFFTSLVLSGIKVDQKSSKPNILKFIGDRSYSLYLWHWPVITMYPRGVSELTNLLGICVITAILAEVSYRIAEHYPRRLGSNRPLFGITIAAYSSLLAIGLTAFCMPNPDKDFEKWKSSMGSLFDFKEHGQMKDIQKAFVDTSANAILIGDSHAQVYLQPFVDFCEFKGLTYQTFISSGFYSLGERNFYALKKSTGVFKDFKQMANSVLLHDKILKFGEFDYVFIAQRFDCFYRSNNPHDSYSHLTFTKNKDTEAAKKENINIIQSDMLSLVKDLTNRSRQVIILGQIPSQVYDPRNNPGLSEFRPSEFYSGEADLIQKLEEGRFSFVYFNPRNKLEKKLGINAWGFYRDDDHLNLQGIKILSTIMQDFLTERFHSSQDTVINNAL